MERRQHTRVPIEDVTVEIYTQSGDPDSPEVCTILNLSETGMLFEATGSYPPKQLLRLTFVLPDSMVIIRTNATVIHTHQQWDGLHVGVEFGKLGTLERREIKQFVEQWNRNQAR